MPPLIKITPEPILLQQLLDAVRGDVDGGIASFVGTVRNHADGHHVTGLTYTAYAPMAEKIMRQIYDAAVVNFNIERAAIVHRVGDMKIGDAVVAVIVATPHRAPALDAVRYIIDRVKAETPIWKREHHAQHPDTWVNLNDAAWEQTQTQERRP